MAIERYDPFKNVERLFKESFLALIGEDLKLDLAVDVYEKKNNVVVQMNLAGIDPENINISIEENFLTISGVCVKKKTRQKRKVTIVKKLDAVLLREQLDCRKQ